MTDLPSSSAQTDNAENYNYANTTSKRNLTIEEIRANLKRKGPTPIKVTDQQQQTSINGPPQLSINSSRAKPIPAGHTGGPPSREVTAVSNAHSPRHVLDDDAANQAPHRPTASRRAKQRDPPVKEQPLANTEPTLIQDKYVDLANLCEEILTYCHLLDHSRNYTVNESLNLRITVRELERLLDSARLREASHLSDVEMHRDAITTFEKRYYSLKARAKTHIKECQDDRDRIKAELDTVSAKMKSAESDLYEAQSLVHSQQVELERLREQTKSLPSEKELNTMSLKLRRLEDENGRLATERHKLLQQLDQAQHGGKRDEGRGSIRGGEHMRSKREAELEATNERLNQDVQKKSAEIERLEEEVRKYHEYCEILLEKVGS